MPVFSKRKGDAYYGNTMGENGGNAMNATLHFILSIIAVIGVFLLTYSGKLQGQAATTLIAMIVGYLFGKGRK